MQTTISVIIADDNEIYSKGLCHTIEQLPGVEIISTASNANEVLQKTGKHLPQIVFLDAQLPPGNAIDVCRQLHQQYPATGIIAIGHNGCSSWLANEMLNAGAWSVLFEKANKMEIQLCLMTTHSRSGHFTKGTEQLKFITLDTGQPKLNEREVLLMKLLCEELKSEEIAKRMFLSPYTVENMRKALLQKLGAKSIVGIVKHAIRLGIVTV
jgi:DNA-binding NarL/FixJ family response regulator